MQHNQKSSSDVDYIKIFVTFGGLGCIPKAPGTWGSLGTIPFVILLAALGAEIYMVLTLLFLALSLWITAMYLHKNPDNQDPKEVVVDEVVGILVTFFLVPVTPLALLVGFLMFRVLDILKPPPISIFDKKVPGAAGVMSDDIVAGFIANMLFHFLILPNGWLNGWPIG
ncbi:MAG: phosphatidylglycerophosphatase A [Bdellovibrionaceae bacterium]|nr:phosphatidylglycerophosphatase A [Pseudobdellovibrionaceae bacterium]